MFIKLRRRFEQHNEGFSQKSVVQKYIRSDIVFSNNYTKSGYHMDAASSVINGVIYMCLKHEASIQLQHLVLRNEKKKKIAY